MLTENRMSFKEWAVIVEALGRGQQILLFRKGGIQEDQGQFSPEHREFFLFPTFVHQKPEALKLAWQAELTEVLAHRPREGIVPIEYYAVAEEIARVTDLAGLKQLTPLHAWSEGLVEERFHFGREKGLYVMALRVFRLPEPRELPALKGYEGCKSWVSLEQAIPTQGTRPVLSDEQFHKRFKAVHDIFYQFQS